MSASIFAIYGAAGCGRSIMPVARRQLASKGIEPERLCFVDDSRSQRQLNGQLLLSYSDFLTLPATERYVAIAVANPSIREQLADRCKSDGVMPWTVCADNAVLMDDVEIGEGALISPFATIASNVRIGRHFHCNLYSYVEHDCTIGDFVTFAPGVKCNGNVAIEDGAYIGAGALLRQGTHGRPLKIGQGAIVGMGAVVTRDVEPATTVYGNPARVHKA